MKVLHFLDTVGRGGAEMHVLDICRNAREFGIDLTFITSLGGALEDDFRASGADFIKLGRKLPLDPFLVRSLRSIIKERGIQVVHGYQPVENLHLYLAALGMPDVKQVMSFQGFIPDTKNLLAARFLVSRIDENIVVSEGLREWLKESLNLDIAGRSKLVYNSVDGKRLRPGRNRFRRELAIAEDIPLLGMVGNFYRDPRKDHLTVCRSLPAVFVGIDNAHCVFAGRVERGAEAKFEACLAFCEREGISDRVHFLGARADVPEILEALDVFVFSSRHEGLPIAVVEAMLSQVPLVISEIGPLLEMTDGGRYAEVFKTGDATDLSEKVLKLLRDPDLRHSLAADACRFAQLNFSIGSHLTRLKALYDDLAG